MNDIELADKVVALGVAARSGEAYALISNDPDDFFTYAMGKARYFVRDWRVAGALIIKCLSQGYRIDLRLLGVRITTHSPTLTTAATTRSIDQVPAIIKACVDALEQK